MTVKSYNNAVRALKNEKSDILCKPWYFGNALPYHIPNNTDITVTYKNGKVEADGAVLRRSRRSIRSSLRLGNGRSSTT